MYYEYKQSITNIDTSPSLEWGDDCSSFPLDGVKVPTTIFCALRTQSLLPHVSQSNTVRRSGLSDHWVLCLNVRHMRNTLVRFDSLLKQNYLSGVRYASVNNRVGDNGRLTTLWEYVHSGWTTVSNRPDTDLRSVYHGTPYTHWLYDKCICSRNLRTPLFPETQRNT